MNVNNIGKVNFYKERLKQLKNNSKDNDLKKLLNAN